MDLLPATMQPTPDTTPARSSPQASRRDARGLLLALFAWLLLALHPTVHAAAGGHSHLTGALPCEVCLAQSHAALPPPPDDGALARSLPECVEGVRALTAAPVEPFAALPVPRGPPLSVSA